MSCKRYHIIFSTISSKFKWKISVQKGVIRSFKNYILVTWPATKLLHFKTMLRVWKTKSPLFCLGYDPLIVFWRQNHITFIFIKIMSHDLLVQMAYSWDHWHRMEPDCVFELGFFSLIKSIGGLFLIDCNLLCLKILKLFPVSKVHFDMFNKTWVFLQNTLQGFAIFFTLWYMCSRRIDNHSLFPMHLKNI